MMSRIALRAVVATVQASACFAVQAQESAEKGPDVPAVRNLDTVQVTATRFGDPVQEVPGSISVVTGDELRNRGATDLRTALALLPGVSVSPLSDAGPAGSVPSLLGIRELDDLLLLIDGIPTGGAYAPRVEAISLNDVERIEVIRGAAPVYFGTTAFAGTINVIHYGAGSAENVVRARAGSFGSRAVSGSAVLSDGPIAQSLRIEGSQDRPSSADAEAKRLEAGYRMATDLGAGRLRADVTVLTLRQRPTSPTPLDTSTGTLASVLSPDYDANPKDAKLDTDRYLFVLGYDMPLSFGRFGTTLSYADTRTSSIRGFIDTGDTKPPYTIATKADLEAFQQSLHQRDLFYDAHVTFAPIERLDLTTGINALVGRADADSTRYNFKLPLDGTLLPNVGDGAYRGIVAVDDYRRFFGVYAQSRYRLTDDASLLAGLRWNRTHETYGSTRLNQRNVLTLDDTSQENGRMSGSIGAQWRAIRNAIGPLDGATLHASYGNTFQPPQIDFGPDPEAGAVGGGILKAETQRSVIAGIRADGLGGRLDFDVDAFYVDFDNQPIQTTSGGVSVLEPVGKQRYRGVDIESAFSPVGAWTLKAHATWSDARFRDFTTAVDGIATQLAGNRQILTPTWRGGGGIVYAPAQGVRGSLTATYIGRRYLDVANRFTASGFTLLDASLGYRFTRYTLVFAANNITNRRDPILASELGDGAFYRMPPRRFDATLSADLR